MNNYCQYLYTVVSSDCSRLAGCWVGLSKHHPDMSLLRFWFLALTKPASLDSTLPFPCHCHHWAWVHVGHLGVNVVALCKLGVVPLLTHKSWEEWSGWQIRIVLPEMSLTGSHHPEQRVSGLILRKLMATNLMATSLKPFCSNLFTISPTSPRWNNQILQVFKSTGVLCTWTPSGLIMMKVLSAWAPASAFSWNGAPTTYVYMDLEMYGSSRWSNIHKLQTLVLVISARDSLGKMGTAFSNLTWLYFIHL